MRCQSISKFNLRCGWEEVADLQLKRVYKTLFEAIYEGPDMRISVGLIRAYLFVFRDEDYQKICVNILK